MRVFGKKPVAGVNRVDVSDLGGADDAINLKIALQARCGPNADRLIRQLDVQAFQIGLRIDGDSLDAELFAGSDDSEGDLAAIGDKDFFEHC